MGLKVVRSLGAHVECRTTCIGSFGGCYGTIEKLLVEAGDKHDQDERFFSRLVTLPRAVPTPPLISHIPVGSNPS